MRNKVLRFYAKDPTDPPRREMVNDKSTSQRATQPESVHVKPIKPEEAEFNPDFRIQDAETFLVGTSSSSPLQTREMPGHGGGGGGGYEGRCIRNRPARCARAHGFITRILGDHAAVAGASNNPRAFSNATWGTGRPPTA